MRYIAHSRRVVYRGGHSASDLPVTHASPWIGATVQELAPSVRPKCLFFDTLEPESCSRLSGTYIQFWNDHIVTG